MNTSTSSRVRVTQRRRWLWFCVAFVPGKPSHRDWHVVGTRERAQRSADRYLRRLARAEERDAESFMVDRKHHDG